jgi:hypothetical protein
LADFPVAGGFEGGGEGGQRVTSHDIDGWHRTMHVFLGNYPNKLEKFPKHRSDVDNLLTSSVMYSGAG